MDNFAVEICYDLPRFAASFNNGMQRTALRAAADAERYAH